MSTGHALSEIKKLSNDNYSGQNLHNFVVGHGTPEAGANEPYNLHCQVCHCQV